MLLMVLGGLEAGGGAGGRKEGRKEVAKRFHYICPPSAKWITFKLDQNISPTPLKVCSGMFFFSFFLLQYEHRWRDRVEVH